MCFYAFLSITLFLSHRNKDIKQEIVKEWLEDDFEWPPQKKTSNTGTKKKKKKPALFSNYYLQVVPEYLNHSPNGYFLCAQLQNIFNTVILVN